MAVKRILLVEDRDDDVVLLQMALKHCGHEHILEVRTDGQAAIEYLSQVQSSAFTKESKVPHLVLLDIKMPKVNGHEVLQWIRQQMQFKTMPVLMLSSSDLQDDIIKALHLGANSYLTKTGDLSLLKQTMQTVARYWFEVHRNLV